MIRILSSVTVIYIYIYSNIYIYIYQPLDLQVLLKLVKYKCFISTELDGIQGLSSRSGIDNIHVVNYVME